MDAHRALLGLYTPGCSVWHRAPLGVKYVVFLALMGLALASTSPTLSVAVTLTAMGLAASTRVPWRWAWGLPWGAVALLGVLAGYQVAVGRPDLAVTVVASILVGLYGARLVLFTTPVPDLIDGLVTVARPLRRLGVDPERFGLAVAVMLRSIPFVAGAFGDVQQAARARGLGHNPVAALGPVVVQTVYFARSTGEALAARGLAETGPD